LSVTSVVKKGINVRNVHYRREERVKRCMWLCHEKYSKECRCQERKEVKTACPIEGKAQQRSAQLGEPEGIAKEKEKERDIRRMFKILREV